MLSAAREQYIGTTRIVHVADRECDIYEFFRDAEDLGEKVPIRAARNRSQDGEKRRTALTYGSVDSDHGNRT